MSMNIRKKTIINRVAQSTSNTQEYTREVVERFLNEIMGELGKGNRLEFRGFGVFEMKHFDERKRRNPKTGENVIIPACKKIKFRMGKDMKNELGYERKNS